MILSTKDHIFRKNYSLFISIYAILAFALAIMLCTFDITVHSLFFDSYGYKYFSFAYVISGFTGVIAFFAYSTLSKKTGTKTFSSLVISLGLAISATFFLLLYFTNFKWIILFGMVSLFPAHILILYALFRFGRKLITPQITRFILPAVKTSYFFGLISGGAVFTIGLYLFTLDQLIWLALLSVAIAWICLFVLRITYSQIQVNNMPKEKYVPLKPDIILFFRTKLTAFTFLFVVLSSIVAFSIHFTFINAAHGGFNSFIGLGKFYSLFTAIIFLFVFGVDKYLIKRLLYSYDSPYSLVLLPVFIFILTIGSLAVNFLLRNIRAYEHFTFFLLSITLLNTGIIVSLIAIQLPGLRTLYQSLDIRFRQIVFSRLEGVAIMTGLLISGGLILGFTFLEFYSLSIVLVVIAFICIIWFFIGVKLLKEYRKNLDLYLSKIRYNSTGVNNTFFSSLSDIFIRNDLVKISEVIRLIEPIEPVEINKELGRLLHHPLPEVRNFVLHKILDERLYEFTNEIDKIIKDSSGEELQLIEKIRYEFTHTFDKEIHSETFIEELFSGSLQRRVYLIGLLPYSKNKDKETLLATLSKDSDGEIRSIAIKGLLKMASKNYSYNLIDFIYPGNYDSNALEALCQSGDQAIDFLEREFSLPSTDDLIKSRIIKIYSKISSKKTIDLILNRLSDMDSYILELCILALSNSRFRATQENKIRILNLSIKVIGIITSNLYAYNLVLKNKKLQTLVEAYAEEINKNYNQLFTLLSLVYNQNVIFTLQERLIKGNRHQNNDAVELLDQYIDADIKPLIFALTEDIGLKERLKRLEYFFPQETLNPDKLISSILTHDYNTLSIYPRACAMIYLNETDATGFEEELIFNANHPRKLLSETALYVIRNHIRKKNTPETVKTFFEDLNFSDIPEDYDDLFINKYYRLKKHPAFGKLAERLSLTLAENVTLYTDSTDFTLDLKKLSEDHSVILSEGNLHTDTNKSIDSTSSFIYLKILKSYGIKRLKCQSDSKIWAFKSDTVNNLLIDNSDFVNDIIKSIGKLTSL